MSAQSLIVYVINLDHGRMARIGALLERAGVAYVRMQGVNGAALTPDERALVDEPAFVRHMGRAMRMGHAGCTLSHMRALDLFLASTHTHAFIVEDDFDIPDAERFHRRLTSLMAQTQHWDFAKAYAYRRFLYWPVAALDGGGAIVKPFNRVTKTLGHLVNRKAAAAIRAAFHRVDEPMDWFLDRPWQYPGVKYRVIVPHLIEEVPEIPTTIGHSGVIARKLPWHQRLPAVWHKFSMGVRRTLYLISGR